MAFVNVHFRPKKFVSCNFVSCKFLLKKDSYLNCLSALPTPNHHKTCLKHTFFLKEKIIQKKREEYLPTIFSQTFTGNKHYFGPYLLCQVIVRNYDGTFLSVSLSVGSCRYCICVLVPGLQPLSQYHTSRECPLRPHLLSFLCDCMLCSDLRDNSTHI